MLFLFSYSYLERSVSLICRQDATKFTRSTRGFCAIVMGLVAVIKPQEDQFSMAQLATTPDAPHTTPVITNQRRVSISTLKL